jgi:hypothetical protein
VANSAVLDFEPGPRATAGSSTRTPLQLLLRVRTRLLRAWLDGCIARGLERSRDRALALRKEQLVGRRERTRLALQLERILADVGRRPRPKSAVPIDRCAVDVAKPVLVEVILSLRSSERVEARGVALGRRLLSNGDSPIYAPPGAAAGDPDHLWHESLSLLFALRPLGGDAATEPLEGQA